MEIVDYLKRELATWAEKAKGIMRKAEDENREVSEEEGAEIQKCLSEVGNLKTRIKEIEDREDLKKAIGDAIASGGTPNVEAAADAKSLGEAFARSDGYKAIKAHGVPSGSWRMPAVEFGAKLTDDGLSVVSIDDAGGNLPLQPQIARGPVTPAENALVIAALFGQGVATQNTLVYLEETTTTPGVLSERYSDSDASVTTTAEGAAKPAAFVDFTRRSKELTKLAAFLPVSDEMLEDEPAIVSYINSRLGLFIRQAEDAFVLDELLAANIGDADGSVDIGGSNWFDGIAAGILRVQKHGGVNPDAVLMNPSDFWTMSTQKAAGDGNYFGGSPYRGPQDNPWGLPVLVTNGVNVGTAIVGAFREGATVWRKGGVAVQASNSHEDYFRKNLTAIRAEERLALTVYRPSAFCRCTQ